MSVAGVSEKHIHAAVIQHHRAFGYPGTSVFTNANMGAMGQAGLVRGVFDLTVIGDGKVRFIELKSKTGKTSHYQDSFRDLLIKNGIDYAITYGRDQPIEVLEMWRICRPRSSAQQGEGTWQRT